MAAFNFKTTDLYAIPALEQGCTFGLQFVQNNLWLGCAGSACAGDVCPFTFYDFDGTNKNKCWGEVFKLYRAAGPGYIHVGDFVGLYIPRVLQWFSLFQNYGHKGSCPGIPSLHTGFQSAAFWQKCAAEVFQIYAKGKPNGAIITDQDTLMFYVPFAHTFVQFRRDKILTSDCLLLLSRQRRPPINEAVDLCPLETVKTKLFISTSLFTPRLIPRQESSSVIRP